MTRLRSKHAQGARRRFVLLWLGLCSSCLCGALAQTDGSGSADSAAAEINRGMLLYRARNLAAAKLEFDAAIKMNPQSADALTWRGITENQLKQYREAEKDFLAALRIRPDEMSAHYNLALALIRLGDTQGAITQLVTVTKAHPGVVEPEYNLAILLEETNATADAAEHLEAAYKTQPEDSGVAEHLAVDLSILGRAEDAEHVLQQLRTSGSPEIREQTASMLIAAGQFKPAIPLLENLSGSQPARLLLARAYIGAEEYKQAIQSLEPGGSDSQTDYLLGLAYVGAGAAPQAQSAFARAVKADPRNSLAIYHLGLLEASIPEQRAEAVNRLHQAMRLEPRNPVYKLAAARILLQQDKAAEALALLKTTASTGPEAAEHDLLLGIAQISLGRSRDAMPDLKHAVAENPSLALSQNILGFCYFEQGEYEKAAATYERASDLRPDSVIFAHDAAIAFERSNQPEKALVYAARAVALPGAGGDDHYLVGKLMAGNGRKEEAISELKQAVALSPDLDAPYYLLARTYMQMGDTAEATQWNAKLTDLKQQHDRAYTAAKSSKPLASSTLLNGAPMSSAEAETH